MGCFSTVGKLQLVYSQRRLPLRESPLEESSGLDVQGHFGVQGHRPPPLPPRLSGPPSLFCPLGVMSSLETKRFTPVAVQGLGVREVLTLTPGSLPFLG